MSKNERLIRKEFLNCNDEIQSRVNEVCINVSDDESNPVYKNFIRLDCECVTKYYEVNEMNHYKFKTIIEDDSKIVDVYDERNGVKRFEVNDTYFDFYGTYINLNDVSLISIIDFCSLMFEEVIRRTIIDKINDELVYSLLSVRP